MMDKKDDKKESGETGKDSSIEKMVNGEIKLDTRKEFDIEKIDNEDEIQICTKTVVSRVSSPIIFNKTGDSKVYKSSQTNGKLPTGKYGRSLYNREETGKHGNMTGRRSDESHNKSIESSDSKVSERRYLRKYSSKAEASSDLEKEARYRYRKRQVKQSRWRN